MPDRSAAASAADAPAAAAGAGADRLVRRKLTDALGLGRSLYAASPAVLKAGLDNLVWLSAPVVNTVVNKVNPLAQGLVDRLDDGVDTVTAKLVSANTTAQAAGADLKFAASQSLELVSKQWHASVDSILVPLHPTLAANVYFTQAVEQFKQLFAAVQAQAQAQAQADAAPAPDAKSAAPAAAEDVSVRVFVARVKQQLAALWDERLVPLTEAFYEAARARYSAGAKSADDALIALKQALGAAWNAQVLQVFASRVGEPSREVYNKVLAKFVHFWDSKSGDTSSIASGPAFVSAMKGALGGLWTDRLRDPVLELYEAIKAQSVKNAQTLRDLAARAQRDTDAADAAAAAAAAAAATTGTGAGATGAVVSLFTALQTQAQAQLTTLQTLLASAQARAQTQAEALSHWSLRRLYSTGQGLVNAAYDQTVTRAVNRSLQLSAVTLDFLLPRAEGEELNPSKAAGANGKGQGKGEPVVADAKAPAADAAAVEPAGPTSGANNALTLRVLRDRASARVRARVQRAVAGAKKAVTRSEALAERTAQQLQPYVGVNVYAESKDFLARTQQLLTSIQSFAVETKAQSDKNSAAVQATVKAAALARVRTALTAVNDEFAKRSSAVQALLQKLDAKTGAISAVSSRAVTVRDAVKAKSKTAAAAIRARLAIAVQKLQSLAAKSREMTDAVLDRELAQLPQDLLRLLRVLPTLLPQQLLAAAEQTQGVAAKAGAKASNGLRALLSALSEAVKAVAAYTAVVAGRVRRLRASSPAGASASASSASSSASASASASASSSSASAGEAASGSPSAAGAGAGATLSPVPSSASLSLTPNNGSPQLTNAVLTPAPAAGAAAAPTAAGAASPVKVIAAVYDNLAAQQAAEAAGAAQPAAVQAQAQAQRKSAPAAKKNGSKRNRRAVAAAADEETVKSADDQPAAAAADD